MTAFFLPNKKAPTIAGASNGCVAILGLDIMFLLEKNRSRGSRMSLFSFVLSMGEEPNRLCRICAGSG